MDDSTGLCNATSRGVPSTPVDGGQASPIPQSARVKVRLRFAKRDRLCWISHHDLLRCLERLLRRARIPIAQTQGFNPRPRLSFALALALGIEGRREVVDMDLEHFVTPGDLLDLLRRNSPEGLDWLEAVTLAPSTPPPEAIEAHYSLAVAPERWPAVRYALDLFLAAPAWLHTRERPGRVRSFDLRSCLVRGDFTESGLLRFVLKVERDGSARPEEIVAALGLEDLTLGGGRIVRDDVVLRDRCKIAADRPREIAAPGFLVPPSPTAPALARGETGLDPVQSVFIGYST